MNRFACFNLQSNYYAYTFIHIHIINVLPVGHIVVLATPAKERIRKAVYSLELLSCHGRNSAKY